MFGGEVLVAEVLGPRLGVGDDRDISRLGCGGATVDPVTLGSPASTRSAPVRTATWSASTGREQSVMFSLS
ncbi:hypothetical protein Sdagh_65810 [Streptomyces daghestanicus]|uniref:Uncharacterized protein n=1 Tax=Streptomyces daghestanicus TaxID=66885 RepID=A0ABQ3QC60_9ACTN|nr:hypothetical protein Sdagh_65810 [Streptomyces daghestanicus]